ncbi:MAG: hypothetical protein LN563_00680 [Rickettsia endosymbiont of Platyusa sonomae]|nr:hypothetical protein [Rickettsia endosymbiont of Platyusa sonomae]
MSKLYNKKNYYPVQEGHNNISKIFSELTTSKSEIILVPVDLYNKHAVGLIFVKQQDGNFKGYYIDPKNKNIPKKLKQIIADNLDIDIEQQKYANCGSEVIENFMLYLTGERLSQEEAIFFHSQLVEQTLLGNNGVEFDKSCCKRSNE